jgi:hypothetical protein
MPTRLGCALSGVGGAMTDEGRHEHLDRRGNPRTCHPVADAFGDADRHPDAPSTRSDLRQGELAAPKGVIAGWRKAFRPHAPAARPTTANPAAAPAAARRQARDAAMLIARSQRSPLPLATRGSGTDVVLRRPNNGAELSLLRPSSADGARPGPAQNCLKRCGSQALRRRDVRCWVNSGKHVLILPSWR